MAQWEKLNQLHSVYAQQLHELYDREGLPMDVRHYLAAWMEKQEWARAAQDPGFAMVLYQVLMENLDNQYSRFVQDDKFLMQHNMRRYKQNFQRYQECPCSLAKTILWFMEKEKEILQTANLAEQVQSLKMEQSPMNTDSHQNIERQTAGLRNQVQCLEHTLICLEDQQDEFDFKFKTLKMGGTVDATQQTNLQALLNKLNQCRKTLLSDLSVLLDRCAELQEVLVQRELKEWQRRQQRACIGAPDNVCLDQLDKWFSELGRSLFQVLKFFNKLEELRGKLTYDNDPLIVSIAALRQRADTLLRDLLKSSFVVETQPCMPQGRVIHLVLRTNVQFSVKARLLVNFPELNQTMKVSVAMDMDTTQVKGARRFNVLGTASKVLNSSESQTGGMVADFRHLTLREQKTAAGGKGVSEISLSVTEELHLICFTTVFELPDTSVELKTSTLPVVVISNRSQQSSAWASVLWFNMLCHDPTDVRFFANSPVAAWPELGEMLSWQFLCSTQRGLDASQLDSIAEKLFGEKENYDHCRISWAKFSKENSPRVNFTFWSWFDAILTLVKSHLEEMWKDGFIIGFVSKEKVKHLLRRKLRGTFLLRFSESIKDGGVTFSWVDPNNEPEVTSVKPFGLSDLAQIPLHEILRNFKLMATDVPENPLVYLYPDTPKDQALGKYYADKSEDSSELYVKYMKTKLVFVSKEDRVDARSPMYSDTAEGSEGLEGLEGLPSEAQLCGPTADGDAILMAAAEAMLDPMLSSTGEGSDGDLLPLLTISEDFNFSDLLTLDRHAHEELHFEMADFPIGQT